jgi:hypothetical protein
LSRRAKRIWIGGLGLAAAALYAIIALAEALQGLGCEGQSYAMLQTVRCEDARARSWHDVQIALVILGALALLAAVAWALRKAAFWPLAAAAVPAVAVFVVSGVIGRISLAAKPLVDLSGVRIVDRRCARLCPGGLRVAFTNDRMAPVWFDYTPDLPVTAPEAREYRYVAEAVTPAGPSAPGATDEFAAGGHVVQLRLFRQSPDGRRSLPLRPGVYGLDITALVENPGNQSEFMTAVSREFRVLGTPQEATLPQTLKP